MGVTSGKLIQQKTALKNSASRGLTKSASTQGLMLISAALTQIAKPMEMVTQCLGTPLRLFRRAYVPELSERFFEGLTAKQIGNRERWPKEGHWAERLQDHLKRTSRFHSRGLPMVAQATAASKALKNLSYGSLGYEYGSLGYGSAVVDSSTAFLRQTVLPRPLGPMMIVIR